MDGKFRIADCGLRISHRRRGVSLMEVLISIFVLSIGLFGVAALIPVGGSEILESIKADRSAAVGSAAMRDVKVRKMLDPYQWGTAPSDVGQLAVPMWYSGGSFNAAVPQHVLIDPLFAASTASTVFPTGGSPQMVRVNLRDGPSWSRPVLTLEGAREIFVSKDDALFDIPRDKKLRPRMVYRVRASGQLDQTFDAQGRAFGNYNPTTCAPEADGNYSWMAMISPAASEYPYASGSGSEAATADVRCRVNCSIVVFYKRNLSATDAEVVATASITGGGYGGGDVRLTATDVKHFERVRKNQWLLLSSTGGPPPDGKVFQWYRVVAVGEDQPMSLSRDVTLSGPDWTAGTTAQAVLMQGVVGVFTKVIELDRDLLRSK